MCLKTVTLYKLLFFSTLILIVTTTEEMRTLITHWKRNQLIPDNNQQINSHINNASDLKGPLVIPATTINNLTTQFVNYHKRNNSISSTSSNNNNHHYQDHEALIKAFLDLLLAYRINGLPNLQDTVVIEGAANGFRNFLKQLTNYVESNPDLIIFGLPSSNTTVFNESRRLFVDWLKMRGQSMNEWWTTVTKYSTTTTPTINF